MDGGIKRLLSSPVLEVVAVLVCVRGMLRDRQDHMRDMDAQRNGRLRRRVRRSRGRIVEEIEFFPDEEDAGHDPAELVDDEAGFETFRAATYGTWADESASWHTQATDGLGPDDARSIRNWAYRDLWHDWSTLRSQGPAVCRASLQARIAVHAERLARSRRHRQPYTSSAGLRQGGRSSRLDSAGFMNDGPAFPPLVLAMRELGDLDKAILHRVLIPDAPALQALTDAGLTDPEYEERRATMFRALDAAADRYDPR